MENILLYHLAMALIGSMFLLSGIYTAFNLQGTLGLIRSKKLPLAKLGLFCTLVLKIFAGVMIIINFHAQIAAASLLIFVIAATFIFHNFWSMSGRERMSHYFAFLSNLCILGGLMLVMIGSK